MRCGSCGADMVIVGGRYVCPSCDFSGCHSLAELLAEYLTRRAEFQAAEDPDSPVWSPIRAACLEPDVNRVAREIADLLSARTAPVLV